MNKPIVNIDRNHFGGKFEKSSGCWDWKGGFSKKGYGVYWRYENGKKCAYKAHRVSWTLENGPIPDGKIICHSCDNTKCINPKHLWLGTEFDNCLDSIRKGRWWKTRGELLKHRQPVYRDSIAKALGYR